MFKNLKWSAIIVSVVYMAVGVLLIMYPQASADVICDVIGYSMIISGVINIVTYFMLDLRTSLYRNDFVIGVVTALLGFLVIYQKHVFQGIIPFILSLIIVASGFSKIQDAIDAVRLGYKNGWVYIVMSLISLVIGLVIMFGKINGNELLFRVIGIGLLYSGISDMYSTIYLSSKIKMFVKHLEEAEKQARMKASDQVIDVQASDSIDNDEE